MSGENSTEIAFRSSMQNARTTHSAPVIEYFLLHYRKIPNISPGSIEVRKHFFGGLIFGGAYIRRAFCVSVRVSRPQNSLLYIAIIGKKGVSLGQNYLYFVLKPI